MSSGVYRFVIGLVILVGGLGSSVASGPVDEFSNTGVKLSKHQTPRDFFLHLKENAERGQINADDVKSIWRFRYLEGIDTQFLEELARVNQIQIDESFSGRLQAMRLYIGYKPNYPFNSNKMPAYFLSVSWGVSILSALIRYPLHMPEGTTLVYAFANRHDCGGEFGPVCASDLLKQSLPENLLSYNGGGDGGFLYIAFHLTAPLLSLSLLSDKKDIVSACEESFISKKRGGYWTIHEASKYLKRKQKNNLSKRTAAIAYGIVMGVVNVVGVQSFMERLTGTVADQLRRISILQFNARTPHEACALAIDRVTTVPCNTIITFDHLQNFNIYTAGTRVMHATVIGVMPYMFPTFVILLQYMVYWLRLI